MDVKHEAAAEAHDMPRWASGGTAPPAAVPHRHFQALGDRARTAEWERRRHEWQQKAAAAALQTRWDAPYLKDADGEDD
jgi:hypothetical protein